MADEDTMTEQMWVSPAMLPPLAAGGVQVWRIRLNGAESSRQEMRGLLDRACTVLTRPERERAARMRAGAPREEFVAGRGCLRRLLAAALDTDPRALVLEMGTHGKPGLKGDWGIEFNVAHSKGVVLIALSRAGAVGVDVECLDPGVELIDVARTAFHPADLARIESAPTQDARLREFYRCWTRKEAVLKADGRGLSGSLVEFATVADVIEVPGTGARFVVDGIEAGTSHLAALARRPGEANLQLLELSARSLLLFLD